MKLFRWWKLYFCEAWIHHKAFQLKDYGEKSVRRKFRTAKIPYGEDSVRRKFCKAIVLYGEKSYGEKSVRQKSIRRKVLRRKFIRRKSLRGIFRPRLAICQEIKQTARSESPILLFRVACFLGLVIYIKTAICVAHKVPQPHYSCTHAFTLCHQFVPGHPRALHEWTSTPCTSYWKTFDRQTFIQGKRFFMGRLT